MTALRKSVCVDCLEGYLDGRLPDVSNEEWDGTNEFLWLEGRVVCPGMLVGMPFRAAFERCGRKDRHLVFVPVRESALG